jgi:phage-related tail fiber protein
MTNLTEKEQWEDGVYQIEKTDPVVGGPDGLSNRQGQQLANRTKYLKGLVDGLLSGARNAAVAVKLATARAINLTGDAGGSANFDGSANATINVTLASTGIAAGTYGSLTVDGKGRATAGSTITPIANGGTGNSTGLAPSAAKLATARTINGVPFDGTANIAITDDSKAPLNSPVLTGDPRAPTPAAGDNDTSIATTAFVQAAIAALVNGSPEALNQLNELAAALGNNPNYATDIATALGLKAPLSSPALTGTPTAPTPETSDSSGRLATTAFAQAIFAALGQNVTQSTLSVVKNVSDWAKPAGWRGFVNFAGSVNTPGDLTTGYAYYAVVARRDAGGGYGSILLTHGTDGTMGDLWIGRSSMSTVAPTWRKLVGADQLSAVAFSGQFADLAPTAAHWLLGKSAVNGWKIAAIQNTEPTGSIALEMVNAGGYTVMSYQGMNDRAGGWRPRMYYTKSGDAAVDRRTYWLGVNDSDVVEAVGAMQVRLGGYLADSTGAALCVKSDATDGTGGLTVNSFAPTLAMVDRSSGARSSRWRTDSNVAYLDWDNGDNGSTWAAPVLSVTPSGEIRSHYNANNYRIAFGDYGTFWRNDGNNFWLAITAAGDPYGTFGALRPFVVNMATGQVTNSTGLAVPTHPRGNSSSQAASTAFVQDATGSRTAEIAFFSRTTAPAGFLKANGAAISRTTYADLFAIIGTNFGAGDGSTTFNLPDLRGEFLRAWDDGRGVDSGRALNTSQASQNLSHAHAATSASAGAHTHTVTLPRDMASYTAGSNENAVSGDETRDGNGSFATSSAGAHTHTITISADGGNEARPRNVALLACIKY